MWGRIPFACVCVGGGKRVFRCGEGVGQNVGERKFRHDRDEWVSFHAGPPAPHPTAPHDLPGYNVVTHDLSLPNGGLASAVCASQNPRTMPPPVRSIPTTNTLLHSCTHYLRILFWGPQSISIFNFPPVVIIQMKFGDHKKTCFMWI